MHWRSWYQSYVKIFGIFQDSTVTECNNTDRFNPGRQNLMESRYSQTNLVSFFEMKKKKDSKWRHFASNWLLISSYWLKDCTTKCMELKD